MPDRMDFVEIDPGSIGGRPEKAVVVEERVAFVNQFANGLFETSYVLGTGIMVFFHGVPSLTRVDPVSAFIYPKSKQPRHL